ncbi:peptidoglycan-binding domain-containing protein [Streptomyces sp. NPDC093509]|uniref:peptidoglycan-binding domain-containing protein n=1 Tax=Streptomyces sp. NPDC093509 TaxID=3154982 RepID=UPI0034500D88
MLVTAVAASTVGVAAVVRHSSAAADPRANAAPSVHSAKVVRRDLSNSTTAQGHLGFGPLRQLKGAGMGTLTKLPSAGTTTARGEALYRVDDKPVPVFYGDTPFFRELKTTGLVGNDVSVLRSNLAALGYDVGDAAIVQRSAGQTHVQGATFTASLAAALKRWQQDAGVEPTGTLKVGQVIVLPGQVRVHELKAQVGDLADQDILSYVSPKKVLTVPVEAQQVSAIKPGDAVTIILPDSKISGMVKGISHKGSSDSDASDTSDSSKIDVTVLPKHASDVAKLSETDLSVEFVSEVHKNVLTVPIGALVALSGGGFAVQCVGGELLRVETGMFATGLVEISGQRLAEGLAVEVAS